MVDKSTKHLVNDLKQFFMREIATISENMNKKFDELGNTETARNGS